MKTVEFTQLSDENLINNVKQYQDSYSLDELKNRHSGIVFEMAKKFGAAMQTGNHMTDLKDELPYLVWKAAESFDPDKGKFVTWLGNRTRFHCLNKIKEENKYTHVHSDETEYYMENIYDQELLNSEKIKENSDYIKEIAAQMKDDRIAQIVELRYFSGRKKKSFNAIGDAIGLTHQGVIDLHERFIAFVRQKLQLDTCIDSV